MASAMHDRTDKYTKICDAQIMGLYEAGASRNEVLAYLELSRFHNDPEHPARCWVSAQYASEVTGIDASCFSRALRSLCGKVFTVDKSGNRITVLTQISKGHNGRAATYNDNLYEFSTNGSYPVARQDSPATTDVARHSCLPTKESSKADTTCYEPNEADSSKANQAQLQGSPAHPHKDELPASQPNTQGGVTEEGTSEVDPLVSWYEAANNSFYQDAPYDSYGMTEEERDAYYTNWQL